MPIDFFNPNAHIVNPDYAESVRRANLTMPEMLWGGFKQTVGNIGDASGDFRDRGIMEAAMNAEIMNRPDFIDPSWRKTPDLLKRRVDSADPSTWAQGNFPMIGGQATMPTKFPMEDTIDPEERAEWLAGSTGRDLGQAAPVAKQAVTGVQSRTPPVEPGIIAPDPGMDPAGNLAAKNANIAAGAGNVHGQVKPAPDTSMADARAAIFKDLGQQVSFDNEELEPWYESPTFYRGLVSFGLNLLSGNDLGASFNQAGQYYDQERGREKRGQWRDDLIEAGYNPTEIEAYIDTGDNKLLTDPMERQKQLMDMEAGQLGLDKARWEASHRDEDRQREIDKEAREEERQARKDALSEQLTRSSIAENEAQRKKALGLVTGGETGSGDLSRSFKPTEANLKAQGYSDDARAQFQSYEERHGGVDRTQVSGIVEEAIKNGAVKQFDASSMSSLMGMMDTQQRAQFQDQMSVLIPLLRKDSGASISAGEYINAINSYFGQQGDSEGRLKDKRINLMRKIEGINPGASEEFKRKLRGRVKDVFYDEDYSGVFIDDGKSLTKYDF